MADEQVLEQEQPKTDTVDVSTMLQNAAFGDNATSHKNDTDVKLENTETKVEVKPEDNVVEPFYKKLGFEKEDDVVNEITTLREKASKVSEEPKFADEQSKQIHELIREGKKKEVKEFLETQEQLEELSVLQVNKDNAADIIKLQIKLKNPQLTSQDVDFEYKQNYGVPKEPVQKLTEDEDDFNERHNDWKEQVESIERKREIAAKMAQPELAKLKTEITLPTIERDNAAEKEPSPEDLAAFETAKKSFIETFQNVNKDFNGFTATVKNKDVDYNVAYAPSQEEKSLVSAKMQTFAESGFNANALFTDRWVNNDNTINVNQMTEDLSRIFMGKNSDAKIANEAANKRLELYLKDKKQIDLTHTNEEGKLSLDKGNETIEDKLREKMLAL